MRTGCEEMRNLSYHNPVQREMLDTLHEIKDELKKKTETRS
ncbi:MAG: hypothetical protein R6W78_08500 [Bacteroidales bacterium]